MNLRPAQAQSMIPRPGVAPRGPSAPLARESARPTAGGRSAEKAGASARGAAGAAKGAVQGEGSEGARREEARGSGGLAGAGGKGFAGADAREGAGRGRLELLQGEARPALPRPEERPAPVVVAPELSRERVERREDSSPRQTLQGRAKLRAVVLERLQQGMTDVHGRLSRFLENPGRLGVVNLSLVLSESSVTMELWRGASDNAGSRESLARSLGAGAGVGDAELLRLLLPEVHEAFEEFQASRPGREARARYEEVLQHYEDIEVLPVVPGHDTGPMRAELTRLGVACPPDFTRSLLVSPKLLAVGLAPDEGRGAQVMVAGLVVQQLGALVAQLRRLHPCLSNRQVLQLLLLASTDLKSKKRKALGAVEVEQVHEYARQLLRLQAVERLHC